MYFKKPIIDTNVPAIKFLAPIPVFQNEFTDHDLHDRVFQLGFTELTEAQRKMGQELPGQYDKDRYDNYKDWYGNKDQWVEDGFPAIGSRFSVPPNDLLDLDKISKSDVVIIAVAHDEYKEITKEEWQKIFNGRGIFIDVKSIYKKDYFTDTSIIHWRL